MTEQHAEAFDRNRLAWDERVPSHADSPMYRKYIGDLRRGDHCLDSEEVEAMGSVEGRSLVQLQCHLGVETLSWARLGAAAVGVDFSGAALAVGASLADELGLDAIFVRGNVYDAPELLGRRFELAFVSVGSLCWLPDVSAWAETVARVLEPGGRLLVREGHPFAEVFDDDPAGGGLVVRYPYLGGDEFVDDEQGSYADPDARYVHTVTHSWIHPLGEVVTALATAGFRIDGLSESRRCMWPRFSLMTERAVDDFALPAPYLDAVPNTYLLTATYDGRGGAAGVRPS